jgi:hypothetical protein
MVFSVDSPPKLHSKSTVNSDFGTLGNLYKLHNSSLCNALNFQITLALVGPGGTRYRSWLRHYATTRKVAGSIPNEVIGLFQFTETFQPHYGTGVDSASNRNEYQESSWG